MIKYVVEFIGTFFFLSVILSQPQAIPIVVALCAAIYFGGSISGGHYNPAVSFMVHMNNGLSMNDLALYVASQLAGAYLALKFFQHVQKLNYLNTN